MNHHRKHKLGRHNLDSDTNAIGIDHHLLKPLGYLLVCIDPAMDRNIRHQTVPILSWKLSATAPASNRIYILKHSYLNILFV